MDGEETHSIDAEEKHDMKGEEKDGALLEDAYLYITTSAYPEGCTDSRKRVIRKKAKKFHVSEGELFYKKKQKGMVFTSAILYRIYIETVWRAWCA